MLEYLKKLLSARKAKLAKLQERNEKSENLEEVRALSAEITEVTEEIRSLETQIASLEAEQNNDNTEERNDSGFNPNMALNIIQSNQMNQGTQRSNDEDLLSTMEYRTAFKHYAPTGERSERLNEILSEYYIQTRATGEVTSEELGVLIPHTILQELIKKIEGTYGRFSSRVRMLNVQGGVEISIGDFEATFIWNGTDGNDKEHGVSEEQKVNGVTGSVVFSYHIGEIRIAQSLLQSILSVEIFEKELINALLIAYLKARDIAVLRGTGEGQPTGILTDIAKGLKRVPTNHIIEFTEEEIADWTAWEKKLFAEIPISMEGANPEFAMAKQTYVSNLCTLKDANNQPIKKAGFDVSDRQHKFNEYTVLRTEQDLFKSFDLCQDGEYFGIFWVPEKAYGINSNMTFGYKRYFDDDKNKWITKGLVILDGKPLNTQYIYLLKKKVTA